MMTDARSVATFAKYAAGGTLGSLLVAYGLREFLRASGGGYYCCNHAYYQALGMTLTFAGWVVLLYTFVTLYDEL